MGAYTPRTVNVHEAKIHFSRQIDAAHAGEMILVAKDGRPWAQLMQLEQAAPDVLIQRIALP